MKRRRPLSIIFAGPSSDDPGNMFNLLDGYLSEGWSRAKEEEARWKPALATRAACYRCEASKDRPAAYLVVNFTAPNQLSGGRVFLADGSGKDASVVVWNVVVADFYWHCVYPIASHFIGQLALKNTGLFSENISIAALMPPPLFELLQLVTTTRREDGWLNFHVAAFGTPHRLTSELLGLWLMDHGWGVEAAEAQARQFDFAQRLLACAESAR